MSLKNFTSPLAIGVYTIAIGLGAFTLLTAQQGGGGRGGSAQNVFTVADADKDGAVTRAELKAAFAKWLADGDTARAGALTQEQLATALNAAFPPPAAPQAPAAPAAQNQTPRPADVERMMAALPAKAPAKPKQARKVLVLSKTAGFVHSCIPLVGKTMEEMGAKTGAWTATVTYDPAAINTENLKQYDLLFLNNNTGAFLDDPTNPAATEARRKALLEFVRAGKGIAGIHAASDSYHQAGGAPAATAAARGAGAGAGFAGGFGGGRGQGTQLAAQIVTLADKNTDQKVNAAELAALADSWFDKLDTEKAGKVSRQDFATRFASVLPAPAPRPAGGGGAPSAGRQGRDNQVGTWPEYNKMIGGFFKYHWMDPQHIVYKIDDLTSPLTAMFKGPEQFSLDDETYTFGVDTWSRQNLHILTSVDYSKMSEADKLKEDYPREDHDYGLSWIRREGKGRIFYEAHGHNEKIYANPKMLEHVLAGVQYALGDLKANDDPSVKPKK